MHTLLQEHEKVFKELGVENEHDLRLLEVEDLVEEVRSSYDSISSSYDSVLLSYDSR